MIIFSPLLPWPVVVIFLALAVPVSLWGYWRLGTIIKQGYLTGLLSLRGLSLAGVALLLLNPSLKRLIPDPAALKTLILADCSGSMGVRDGRGGKERFQTIRDVIQVVEGHPEVFGENDGKLGFNQAVFPLASPIEPTGRSGIGEALNAVAEDADFQSYAAVILISDGHWNVGGSPVKAAMELGRLGLPVSCVFAGGRGVPGDISITASDPARVVGKGETCRFSFAVKSSMRTNQTCEVVFSESGNEIARKKVTVSPARPAETIYFDDPVWRFGTHVYSAKIVSPSADSIPENDRAFQSVEVAPPEEFKVAYLSGSLNWDFKMIKQVLEASNQFAVSAMIQTSPKRFFRYGDFLKADDTQFPCSLRALSRFDLVILRYDALPLMGKDAEKHLEAFVDKRGGGLLVMGGAAVPAGLSALLPVKTAREDVPPADTELGVSDERVFPPGTAVSLYAAPGARVPGGFPVAVANQLKLSSRPVIAVGNTPRQVVLAVQHFGGGRVGWLGFEGTWRWPLAGTADKNRHVAFWEQLSVWLASGSKPRIHIPLHGKTVQIGGKLPLTADLLDANYQPVTQGDVRGTLTRPDGTVEELTLAPSPDHPGRFEAPVKLARAGECKFTVRMGSDKTGRLSADAYFIASHGGKEMNNPVSREDVLRDIARVSGGRFFNGDDGAALRKGVPVSDRVPRIEGTRHPTESVVYGMLLLASLCGEWYFRRRIGLK